MYRGAYTDSRHDLWEEPTQSARTYMQIQYKKSIYPVLACRFESKTWHADCRRENTLEVFMLPFVLAALMQSPDATVHYSDRPDVLVEQCGRRLLADTDYDLGRQIVYVQDVATDEIVYSEDIAEWATAQDYADTLNICEIAG
jgi:hypothetical protein